MPRDEDGIWTHWFNLKKESFSTNRKEIHCFPSKGQLLWSLLIYGSVGKLIPCSLAVWIRNQTAQHPSSSQSVWPWSGQVGESRQTEVWRASVFAVTPELNVHRTVAEAGRSYICCFLHRMKRTDYQKLKDPSVKIRLNFNSLSTISNCFDLGQITHHLGSSNSLTDKQFHALG